MKKVKAHARDEDIDYEIGRKVREIRLAQQMTQTTLGDHVGVSFQQVQKYERGDNRISASALVRICQALNISPMEIIGRYFDENDVHAASYAMRMKLREAETCLAKIHEMSEKFHQEGGWETMSGQNIDEITSKALGHGRMTDTLDDTLDIARKD